MVPVFLLPPYFSLSKLHP